MNPLLTHQLFMKYPNDLADDICYHKREIYTGAMSECMTVVVLYLPKPVAPNHPYGAYPYRFARGFHGAGGFEHINFDSLFSKVLNKPSTKVIAASGFSVSPSRQLDFAHEVLAQLDNVNLDSVQLEFYHQVPRIYINRHSGLVWHGSTNLSLVPNFNPGESLARVGDIKRVEPVALNSPQQVPPQRPSKPAPPLKKRGRRKKKKGRSR